MHRSLLPVKLAAAAVLLLFCERNQPPDAPSTPGGPASIRVGDTGRYVTSTIDPDADSIAYQFDWGDGSLSAWSATVASGEAATMTKAWQTQSTFSVMSRAKDSKEAVSEWSGEFNVTTLEPGYKEPMINGFLYRVEYYDRSVEYFRQFEVFDNDGLRMVPVLTVNGEPIRILSYTSTRYLYADEKEFPVDTTYLLEVSHFWGEAWAEIPMPGNFQMTLPPEEHILLQDSALVIRWQKSSRAEWYWVDVYMDYEFFDRDGNWDDITIELDTVLQDTFLLVAADRIFPDYVDEVLEGDGAALVWAGGGPAEEPGDSANVQGAGYGFFSSANEPREKYFYVGAPPARRRSPGTGASLEKLSIRMRGRHRAGRPR
ncbi:MAG: hypothetical protein JSU73_10245 [candidate division WOR-3 bacterium]|nr:MAG: hypothetical protein JSU73_10245 [candidate division WOR-3 bacterium]